jgi:two-component system NarL family sensor kinase
MPDASGTTQLSSILLQHAYKGLRVQIVIRSLLLLFVLMTLIVEPPGRARLACSLIAAAYAAWTVGLAVWTSRGGPSPVRWMWLALFGDAVALGALSLTAGVAERHSWTADTLVAGFVLIPLLAATQLRPLLCVEVSLCTLAMYVAASFATRSANGEPVTAILLRTSAVAALGAGCVGLCFVQRSRVMMIAGLAHERAEMLAELLTVGQRERARLSEELHDGALQYVLAARHDLDDLDPASEPDVSARIDHALTAASGLLRTIVSELHPAVLHEVGLASAVSELATREAARSHATLDVDVSDWLGRRTRIDDLLFITARELLTNVTKHAGASHIAVSLRSEGGSARLVVVDNGVGVDGSQLSGRLAEGHIGLATMRTRVTAAGGTLLIEPGEVGGTAVTVAVPLEVEEAVPLPTGAFPRSAFPGDSAR